MPGAQMIGPYRLERVLGTGSFATVWLARDDVLDRNVAVKILADNWSRDNEVRRRFLSEARVLLTVESPRIVRGFHLGEADTGQPYLVMAWADRGTLGDRIDQRRREGRTFEPREVVGIATEVAHALTDVHGSGHLHRDVKPTNVLIRSSSTRRNTPGLAADETIVLGDFGLARGLDLSALTLVAGSPGYVAPEQAGGLTQLDRRADLYSLGRIMLELLTGDPGGRATTMAGAASERIDVPKLITEMQERGLPVPAHQLVDLVRRLVDEDPAGRPSSAEEVAAELHALSTAVGPGGAPGRPLAPPIAPPPGSGPEGARPLTGTQLSAPAPRGARSLSWKDRRLVAGAAVLVVGVGATIGAMALGGDGSGTESTTTVTIERATTTEPAVVASPPGSTTVAIVIATDPASTDGATTDAPGTDPTGSSETAGSTEAGGTDGPGTDGRDTAPASTAGPETTPVLDTTPAGSTPEPYGALPGQMTIPDLVFVDGWPRDLDAERQAGRTVLAPEAFATALLDSNPDWAADAPPAAGSDGLVRFEVTGPAGVVATVRITPEDNSAAPEGVEIARWVIDYV